MPYEEFIYWQAYFMLEPPDDAANRRVAAIMAHIANMSGKSLPAGKTVSAEDFFGRKEQTAEQQIAFLRAISDGS